MWAPFAVKQTCGFPKRRNITLGRNRGGRCPSTAARGVGAKGLQASLEDQDECLEADAFRRRSAPPAGTGAWAELRCCRATPLAVTPGRWGRAGRTGPESRGGQSGVSWWGRSAAEGAAVTGTSAAASGQSTPQRAEGWWDRPAQAFSSSFPFTGRKGPVGANCAVLCAFGLGTREGGLCKFAKEKEKPNRKEEKKNKHPAIFLVMNRAHTL